MIKLSSWDVFWKEKSWWEDAKSLMDERIWNDQKTKWFAQNWRMLGTRMLK